MSLRTQMTRRGKMADPAAGRRHARSVEVVIFNELSTSRIAVIQKDDRPLVVEGKVSRRTIISGGMRVTAERIYGSGRDPQPSTPRAMRLACNGQSDSAQAARELLAPYTVQEGASGVRSTIATPRRECRRSPAVTDYRVKAVDDRLARIARRLAQEPEAVDVIVLKCGRVQPSGASIAVVESRSLIVTAHDSICD
ncbi:MAG: hypothetical protein MZW92_35680 [Comamonadaceae bacterium]|nr:hypothetical protein [Comamonadaceae bacterium]